MEWKRLSSGKIKEMCFGQGTTGSERQEPPLSECTLAGGASRATGWPLGMDRDTSAPSRSPRWPRTLLHGCACSSGGAGQPQGRRHGRENPWKLTASALRWMGAQTPRTQGCLQITHQEGSQRSEADCGGHSAPKKQDLSEEERGAAQSDAEANGWPW